jgi:TrmH family RNA methyltransferase
LEVIQSKENTLIKHVKKLKEKKYRLDNSAFLIEGFRFVEEALNSNYEVQNTFIDEEVMNKLPVELLESIKKKSRLSIVKHSLFKELCNTENPQGIAAVVNIKKYDITATEGFYVLADKVQDPGNMGTIIRTAHAAGAQGVIYTKGTVDIYNEKTLRSTMGSIFHIPVIEDNSLSVMRSLKEEGFKIIVSTLDTNSNFFSVDLKGNSIICIGNEGNGISDEVMSMADIKLKIPMPGGAESLNVSVASGIMIYEIVRQKFLK